MGHNTYIITWKLFFPIILLFLLFSCSENEVEIIEDKVINSYVTLTDLHVGQTSTYVRYTSFCNSIGENNYPWPPIEFTQDTIILTVIEKEGEMFFEERLTEKSRMDFSFTDRRIATYKVIGDDQKIIIPDRSESFLFFFFGNDTIPVMKEHSTILRQEDCLLFEPENLFIGDEIGKLDQFNVGNMVLLDKRVVSCLPNISPEIDAYLIYDDNQLYQSIFSQRNENLRLANGWALVESDD